MDRRISLLAPDHEFVEMGSGKERRLESSDFVDRCREFLRAPNVLRGDSTKAIRTEDGHVCRGRDREEGLVRADVRHRLLPADVLLPRLERHAERATAFRVSRQADDASRHFPDVLLPTREDSQQRTTEIHLRAERLSLADDDVCSEVSRQTDDRLRDWIHPDDEHPGRHVSNLLELFFESSEEVRILDVDTAYVRRHCGLQLREIEHPALPVVVHLTDVEARAEDVIREDRATIVSQPARDQEYPTAMDSVSHPGRFAERRRAIVHRRVRGVHPGELADEALILPERLEQALADFRLVRGV